MMQGDEHRTRRQSPDHHVLDFDCVESTFIYRGARIGPSTRLEDLGRCLDGKAGEIYGQPGWSNFKASGMPVNASVTFHLGIAHSGYFWATARAGGSWDEAERIEAERRAKHETIAARIFGAGHFENDKITVSLEREPWSNLEQILFAFKTVA